MASTYARITPSSNGNRKTWTFSAWVKRSNTNENDTIFSSGNSTDVEFHLRMNAANTITVYNYQFGTNLTLTTNRLFRDNNAWYHVVFTLDTTQATASDRAKLYINGVEETSLLVGTYPSQNEDLVLPQASTIIDLGRRSSGSNQHFNGLMSHVHFCDGYAYSPTDFGEYDANGVWKIKTNVSVNYGTWGFFVLKDGNSVTDQSGNGNDLTVGGTALTNTEDSPSNVFATLNPLNQTNSGYVFSNGNTKGTVSGQWLCGIGTLAMSSGKYYWEIKYGSGNYGIGVASWGTASTNTSTLSTSNTGYAGRVEGGFELFQNGSSIYKLNNSTNNGSYGTLATAGDIIMVAFDADNYKLYTGLNGTWYDSSNPATGTNPMYTVTSGYEYTPTGSIETGSLEFNFGNGYFGTTAVASAGTNTSGIGIFEYDVPTGYTALSTKGLNL